MKCPFIRFIEKNRSLNLPDGKSRDQKDVSILEEHVVQSNVTAFNNAGFDFQVRLRMFLEN